MENGLNNIVTAISLKIAYSDGEVSTSEIMRIQNDKFLSNYNNDQSFDAAIENIKSNNFDDLLNEESSNLLMAQSKKFKDEFIYSLIVMSSADGSIDGTEKDLILKVCGSCGLSSKDFDKVYEKVLNQVSKYSKSEAVSLMALTVSSADGSIDDKEINIISSHPFFKSYYNDEYVSIWKKLSNEGNLFDVITSEFSFLRNEPKQFKEDLCNALTKIVIADGEVDPLEIQALQICMNATGITSREINEIMNAENERLGKIAAEIKNQKSGGCFVVTATIGSEKHEIVNDFRYFRDNTLSKYFIGILFIKVYYIIGPYFAEVIKGNKFLRKLSLNYFVSPIHKLLIKKNSYD